MSERFRPTYRNLSDPEKLAIAEVKNAAMAMEACLMKFCQPGRETSIAMTNLETCVMWAVKGVTE
jgi:hypothetical protein